MKMKGSFLPAAKRHGHAEVKVEKKEVTFAFLVIVTSIFGVFGILLVSLLQFFHFSEKFSRKNQNFKRFFFKNNSKKIQKT